MKQIIFFYYFLSISYMLAAQMDVQVNKTSIPITLNEEGIPITINDYGYHLDGFDVDCEGNFYFITGTNENQSIIAKYSKDRFLFKKLYKEFDPNRLYILGDTLIVFDPISQRNNLIFVNSNNGEIINIRRNLLSKNINSYAFYNQYLVLEIYDSKNIVDMDPKYYYYDLNGCLAKINDEDFGIFNGVDLPISSMMNLAPLVYIDEWNKKVLYYTVDLDNFDMMFILYNPSNKNKQIQRFSQDYFGKQFYDPMLELMKLRNNKLYILSHEKNKIIVNEMAMRNLFK